MNEDQARKILGSILQGDRLPTGFFGDPPEQDIDEDEVPKARLDGRFTADHLEAIAWWMRNKSGSVK